MSKFLRRLSWLLHRRQKEAELHEELQFHLDEEVEEHQEEGVSIEQAKWAARRDLGNITLLQEDTRATWGWTILDQLVQDARYALRTMGSNRLFTFIAVVSLGLGIGANTAIYSFMDALLLRTLPVPDPESLVTLNWHSKIYPRGEEQPAFVMHAMSGHTYEDPKSGVTAGIFPYPAFELLVKKGSMFSSVFGFRRAERLNLGVGGHADVANGEYVSGDYFRGLGLSPAAGRLIMPDDDRAGAPAVAVISLALSQQRFGSAANAAGKSVLVNNAPFTVIGVTPPEFFGVDPAAAPDIYLPMRTNLLLEADSYGGPAAMYLDQHYYWLQVMARLRPGVGIVQAQDALAVPFHQWVESTATNARERANLPELLITEGGGGLDTLRRRYSEPLYVLMTLVGLILTIGCANIANLLLARATVRRREMALRLSLGAARLRIVRQLLTESVLLALLGGVVGVLFAIWGIRFLSLLMADGNTHFTFQAELNWRVLGVAATLSILTGALFGLAPAIQSTRVDLIPALKEVRAGQSHSRIGLSLSRALVVSQIALSLLILVAAGLFVRTLANLQSVELGFNKENLLLFRLNARQAGHRDPEIASFYGELQRQFRAIPGVRSVSLSHAPLFVAGTGLPISVGSTETNGTRLLFVGPAFCTTMQIPLLIGREINERDRPGSPGVVVVSELFAKTNFRGDNPLGRHLTFGKNGTPFTPIDLEIVGVAKEARYGGLKYENPPVVYIPYYLRPAVYPLNQMTYELRTSGNPLVYVNTIREIVRRADARVPVTNLETQTAEIDETINQEITFAKLCTAFAVLALVIACVGLYGTMSYRVAGRTGEIGIRMALGARSGAVVWMVLGEVAALAGVGLAISVPIALGASKLIASFLFGITPNDPLALMLAIVILLAATFAAGYAPARRASRIDPMSALRHE
jgi:macrolide transport system ATP-binding/permease protein